MNITLGTGKAVHTPEAATGRPLCGTLAGDTRATCGRTDANVTCKRCLKLIAAREAAAERTDYYAGLADAQDMDLSQAEPVDTEDAPAAELCGAQVYDPFRGLAFCTKAKLHDRTTAEGPEHRGNYDEMDAAHAAALAEDGEQFQDRIAAALADDTEEGPACTCPADERVKSGTDNHYIECPQAPAAEPETDPRTGLPIVTVGRYRYVVSLWQRASFGNVDYVDYWLAGESSTGRYYIARAYADAPWGSVARQVWDAQRALR